VGKARAGDADRLLIGAFACAYLFVTGCVQTYNGIYIDLPAYPLSVLVILVFFYYVFPEALYGASPGKALTGLRVLQRSGAACGFTAATLRTLLRPLDLLPLGLPAFLLVRFTTHRQRVGDLLAGTVVTVR
jgi:uncharacterized RDD family membrane protein YckC